MGSHVPAYISCPLFCRLVRLTALSQQPTQCPPHPRFLQPPKSRPFDPFRFRSRTPCHYSSLHDQFTDTTPLFGIAPFYDEWFSHVASYPYPFRLIFFERDISYVQVQYEILPVILGPVFGSIPHSTRTSQGVTIVHAS